MFYEIRFPDSISYQFKVVNEFKTIITTSRSSKEQRNSIWDKSRTKFVINNENLTKNDIKEIMSFFDLMKGSFNGFRFKNWLDFKCSGELIGIYDGENNKFQLKKSRILTDINGVNYSITKNILKPVKNSVKIYINDIEIDNFIVDYSNGIVVVKNILSENDLITADFEYDYSVRFNCDILEVVMKTKNLGEIKDLELIEI